ncbi:MAG: adenylosuccinate synthetase [Candidatus Nanoarchaeia archaeon]|nr:adenylosuccinate synthetase [Candidatus Nanoarchaeia archaeon]
MNPKDIEITTRNRQIISVICNQWGDSGKGKIVDLFANYWADVIARGTGGNNAGHTVVINGKKTIYHLLPSGIAYPEKTNILGNGMVINLDVLQEEINGLGFFPENLMISEDAAVIIPYHIERDKKENTSQAKGGIGTTGRGIGPCYGDRTLRSGILIRDLFKTDTLSKKIDKAIKFYTDCPINKDEIIKDLSNKGEKIRPFVRNTITEINNLRKNNKKILLEGAQGLLLSLEFGTDPYKTSSDCSAGGTAIGAGLNPKDVDLVLGIVKFPYMTRVGGGPFPTELGGIASEEYCAKGLEHNIEFELKTYGVPYEKIDEDFKYDPHHQKIIGLINSKDPFDQGIGLRLAGYEYGATTGRPRRTGWTDLEALRWAINQNGSDIILTKVDVLQGAEEFKLARGYSGNETFTTDSDKLRRFKPDYVSFKGFNEDLSSIDKYDDLPKSLRYAIEFMKEETGANIRGISTGAERDSMIFL